MNEILMVQILYYQQTPPTILANFWWSTKNGLTCDQPRLISLLQKEGIRLPDSSLVYPSDGRVFFDSLPLRFNGVERAQAPVVIDQQGGKPL